MSRISIVSDIHISDNSADSFGIDTQHNFAQVVTHLRANRPDHLMLLGDFSLREPLRTHVEWVHSRAQMVGAPMLAVAGNHDTSSEVAEVFGLIQPPNSELLYYRRDFGNQRALFLDTSAGFMDAEQQDWLHLEMSGARESTLVFMHHPPTAMGVTFMDARYGFRDERNEVYNLLFGGKYPVHVFCGHYHTARSTQIGMHSIHVCPSTYFQIDATQPDFAVSHAMPGMRHIELTGDQLRTWIEFLPKREL